MAAARGIVASSGVAGLYRGNLVNVLRSAPQKSLDFFAFDMFKVLSPAVTRGEGIFECVKPISLKLARCG